MKRYFGVVALLLGVTGTATAQGALRISTSAGSLTPMLPLVSVNDGQHADVELQSAPAVGVELGFAARSWLDIYGSLLYASPRLALSGAMETREADGTSVRTNLLVPTAGVLLSPRLGTAALRPTVRLGVGVKSYTFDLYDQDDRVGNFTGDLGLGVTSGAGPVEMSAEARWLPSTFNARSLPIRAMGGTDQAQNDWTFQLGFRFRP